MQSPFILGYKIPGEGPESSHLAPGPDSEQINRGQGAGGQAAPTANLRIDPGGAVLKNPQMGIAPTSQCFKD